MFLDATPPRLTRQSRIDQWLLLLLRAAAIGLLAVAFTRPYWNTPAEKDAERVGSQRMLLIDTSASMRREGLWKTAIQRAEQIIRESGPTDPISVYQFDSSLRPLVGIESALQTVPSLRQAQAVAALQGVSPTWMHTDLGLALLTAADLLQTDRDSSPESRATTSEIIVVTDFQNGADLERLAHYSWPANCRVRIERVEPNSKGNARATVMDAEEPSSSPMDAGKSRLQSMSENPDRANEIGKVRVRVSNTLAATTDSFRLCWLNDKLQPIESSRTSCQVPSGSVLTVRMSLPPKGACGLQLEGDRSDFDNRYFMTSSEPIQSQLLCVEPTNIASDESLGYFLKQMPMSDAARTVSYQSREPGVLNAWPSPASTPLIVAAHQLSDSDWEGLIAYVEQGGHLLWVMDSAPDENTTKGFEKVTGIADAKITEAKVRQYAMLESVDFKHPLFADLADSKFNDFSKIRFWKHRRLESKQLEDWSVLAKFDDGSPALISKERGAGRVWMLMAGWQPNESQLALSTKFVPLFLGMVRIATPVASNSSAYTVGMKLELPNDQRVLDPDGNEVVGNGVEGKDSRLVEFLEPGVFRQVSSGSEVFLSVNTVDSESNTSVGGVERLEKLGVVLTEQKPAKKDETMRRQLRAVELESQQGWWRWVLLGVVGVIGLESLLCIRKVG